MNTPLRHTVFRLGTSVELNTEQELDRGRQGAIFAIEGEPHLAAKLLRQEFQSEKRLTQLLARDARAWLDANGQPLMAWPIALLTNPDGQMAGYVMVRYDAAWLKLDDVLTNVDRATSD